MNELYEQLTFEEKLHAAGALAKAFVSFYVPIIVLSAVGAGNVLTWIHEQAFFYQAIIYTPLWVLSFVVVSGVLSGLAAFAERLLESAANLSRAIASATANILTLAFYGTLGLAAGALKLGFYPVRLFAEFLWDSAQTQVGLWLQNWHEAQAKRRLYRDEFRADFRSFRDFERYFDNPGGFDAGSGQGRFKPDPEPEPARDWQPPPPPPRPDAFAEACRLLGLPESGAFTAADLKKRFHTAIRRAHPDAGGSNEAAARVNAAHATIKLRKGW